MKEGRTMKEGRKTKRKNEGKGRETWTLAKRGRSARGRGPGEGQHVLKKARGGDPRPDFKIGTGAGDCRTTSGKGAVAHRVDVA